MEKTGNASFIFPVGDAGIVEQIGFTPVSNFTAASTISAEYFYSTSPNASKVGSGVKSVSQIEYWDISNPTNNTGLSCQVTDYFNNNTRSKVVGSGSDIKKVHYDASTNTWNNKGGTFHDNGNGTGYITSTVAISSFSDDGVGSTNGTSLPIELTSFTATKVDANVKLAWTTATETNNDFFTLEKSNNGVDWQTIYTCDGAGTTTIVHSYSHIDNEPYNGVNYYRLQQTDINGQFTYSSIESVVIKNVDIVFMVFPNPGFAEDVNVLIKGITVETASISIDDMNGRHIYSGSAEVSSSQVVIKLADICNNIRPGTYNISIFCGDIVLHKKFVVE